jgi:hypothetical protein
MPIDPPLERLSVCVVRNGELSEVPVFYNPATGDSLYESQSFRDAFPADSTFAASAAWYHTYRPIPLFGRPYVSYGLPRAMRPGEVVAIARYRGLTVYGQPGDSVRPLVVFLPVRPTCEFQPYETEAGQGVRGG